MSSLQTVTYQEEIYKIHPKVLIVIPRSWAEITEEEKALLNKILGSVKQSLAKVDIVTIKTFSPDELTAYGASRIISFGSTLKNSLKFYENLTIDQIQIIVAEDFPLLDDGKKKSLWLALRQMFGI